MLKKGKGCACVCRARCVWNLEVMESEEDLGLGFTSARDFLTRVQHSSLSFFFFSFFFFSNVFIFF